MSRTKRDVSQITQYEHDEASNAKRVKITDTEMSIELDHKDGDSVTSHPDKMIVSSIEVVPGDIEVIPAMPCSSIKRLQLYVDLKTGMRTGNLVTQVSPVDSGDLWFTVDTSMSENKTDIIDICARRVRVIQNNTSGSFEMDVHLVGQG